MGTVGMPAPITASVTSKDGTPIAYQRSGTGPPLVLVHGTTADRTTWDPVLPKLQQHFSIYAMDRRGRGDSANGSADYDIEWEFEDVLAIIHAIGGPVHLFGHSYGAICALEAALRSNRVRGLVLYEGGFPAPEGTALYPPDTLDRIELLLDAGDREGALVTFYRDVVSMTPEDIEMMRSLPVWPTRVALAPTIPREMRAFERYVSNFNAARLSEFGTPTLLLLGGDSPALEKTATEALHAALPDSRITVMPGQAHIAHRTAPAVLAHEAVQFLTGHSVNVHAVQTRAGTEKEASRTQLSIQAGAERA